MKTICYTLLAFILISTPAWADETTSAPTTQATTDVAAQEEEAKVRQESAEQAKQEAAETLDKVESEIEKSQKSSLSLLNKGKQENLEKQRVAAERAKQLADLRVKYAHEFELERSRRVAVEQEVAEMLAAVTPKALKGTTKEQRKQLIDDHTKAMQQPEGLRDAAKETDTRIQALQAELVELNTLRQSTEDDKTRQMHAESIELVEHIIELERLIQYAIEGQARAEETLAQGHAQAIKHIEDYNSRFWIANAYIVNSGRFLIYAILATIGMRILASVFAAITAVIIRKVRGQHALPTVKRIRTLIQFAKSIVNFFIWVAVIVTILAEFDISPGQSAGALGVIGLVLAGMFQQLVVDFVKGIDIAIGGHFYVGDFIQVGSYSGHVLDFTVKYTALRTPSGQIITLPNSQCVPSRRFPAGFVDNYIDIPLKNAADLPTVEKELAAVGRLLNDRIEAIKQTPTIAATFENGGRTYIRVMLRVLPTCDWVITNHYIPMTKQRLADAKIELAEEPTFFYVNDIKTFRRLFSRQITDAEIEATQKEDSRPTVGREAIPGDMTTSK